MNISLPAPLKQWVETQVSQKGYSTASEFVRDVLRREEARARIDDRLLAATQSGESTPLTRQDWDRIRIQGLKLAHAKRKK
jgi:antitoxin ParD1/3/4